MTTPVPTDINAASTPEYSGVEFGINADGFPVARIDDITLAMAVISALKSDHHSGMTEVIATRGGKRDHHIDERRFLVPATDYAVGRFGFVIDEARHAAYDGPSNFVSWAGRGAV